MTRYLILGNGFIGSRFLSYLPVSRISTKRILGINDVLFEIEKHNTEVVINCIGRTALNGIPLSVYGDGENVCDWLHVEDNCDEIKLVMERGRSGEIYNIAGENERTNHQMPVYSDADQELIMSAVEVLKSEYGGTQR